MGLGGMGEEGGGHLKRNGQIAERARKNLPLLHGEVLNKATGAWQ